MALELEFPGNVTSRVRYPRRAYLLEVFDLRCDLTSEAASANRRDLKVSENRSRRDGRQQGAVLHCSGQSLLIFDPAGRAC